MSYKDIASAIVIDNDFSKQDENAIFGVIKEAYAKSSIARNMLDHWVEDLGRKIVFNFQVGAFQATLSTGKVWIDMDQLDHASYIDKRGNAVRDYPFTAIIHELGHALTGRIDNPTAAEPAGENQAFVNTIYRQAGYTEQLAYMAYDASGDVIQRGVDYTDGARIDSAWVKKYSTLSNDHDTTNGGAFTRAYRDLVIGSADDNELKTGAGGDFIYGLGGSDVLLGGRGDDRLNGGEGADELQGAGGKDYASYKLAADGVVVDLADASLNTMSAAGDSFFSIEGIIGSDHGDDLYGDDGDNWIEGRRGGDSLTGRAGNDHLDGGKGVDQALYDFAYETDMFDLGKGTITSSSDGKDRLKGIEYAVFSNGVLDLSDGHFEATGGRVTADFVI